jgi:peptidoglycan-N-acetylglucosamine deacetylase
MRMRLVWGLGGLSGLALGAVLWRRPEWLVDVLAACRPGCLYRVRVRAPLIALTFDDGPDPATTPLILTELARHDAHATFFLISNRVAGREQVVRELVAQGHEVGNHLTRDEPSICLAPAAFEASLLEAHHVLAPYGPARWVRPGSGWYSRAMIDTIERYGYRCALGSVYPADAALPWHRLAIRYILRNARPGAIVILHDCGARGRRTVQVLRAVLPRLRGQGYQVVTLSQLVDAATVNAERP